MKKLLSIVAAAIFMVSCGMTDKAKQVDYTEAHGYFVRNGAPPHLSCYYDSKEAFDSVFGCAAFMGEGGTPTQIDFTRQSVIACHRRNRLRNQSPHEVHSCFTYIASRYFAPKVQRGRS